MRPCVSLMTPMVILPGEGDAWSGKAKALQDGVMLAVGGIVGAVGIDAELKGW